MNPRKIKEDLGRAKTCIQRRDFPRAVYLLCVCLKEVTPQGAPTPLRSDFRSTITDICADPVYKKSFTQPIVYQPGKERELLSFFNKFYKQLMGTEDKEDYEATLQRKLNLDRCINDGKAFISQGKLTEADECFADAMKYYKNEVAAFAMMARAFMAGGHYVRGLGYAKKGLAEAPNNEDLRKLAEECARKRS